MAADGRSCKIGPASKAVIASKLIQMIRPSLPQTTAFQ